MKRRFVFMVMLLVLLALTAPLAAQDATPEFVGLRPDAPVFALHGQYWVGMREYDAETDFHETTVAIWYPALNPDGASETVTYRQYNLLSDEIMTWQGHAIENAVPDMTHAPYPLVVYAHGLYGARFTSAYLTEHLASRGFVVMAIDYADSFRTCCDYDVDLSMYTRPKDVSWQIDYAEQLTSAEGGLPGLIDTENIAVVGHSSGAYTALMAGGAQLDLSSTTSTCVQNAYLTFALDPRPEQVICADTARKLVELAGLETAPEGLWPAWGDPRVDAIVPLAPDIFSFGADSLKHVTVPTMIMAGSKDVSQRSDLPTYKPYLYDNLGSTQKAWVLFEDADHGIFYDTCDAAPWHIDWDLFWVCSDPIWDMERAHDLVNHFTSAFLTGILTENKFAHTILVPSKVDIRGITFEAEGF